MSQRSVSCGDLMWAAGLFEGEGTITRTNDKKRSTQRLRLALAMCDEDVVRRFADTVGVGTVRGPYGPYGSSKKPIWRWQAFTFEHIQAVVAMLWNGLGRRRKDRIKELLAT